MLFTVLPVGATSYRKKSPEPEQAHLIRDNWNDYRFVTLFYLVVFDADGNRHDIGAVKIGQFEMKEGQFSTSIPREFDALDERFFSLGQEENYYETLFQLGDFGQRIFKGLRDAAVDLPLFEKARKETVTNVSLMRYLTEDQVRGRFSRLARGDAALTKFAFAYEFPKREEADSPPLSLSFEVRPVSLPPTNIHVVIGRNGVGKTRCLTNMTRALVQAGAKAAEVGAFKSEDDNGGDGLFVNLVSVTFSAFDPFGPVVGEHAIRYSYVGLKRAPTKEDSDQNPMPQSVDQNLPPMTPEELTEEFVASVGKCRSGARTPRWRKALESLEADPLFEAADVARLSSNDTDDEIDEGELSTDADGFGWENRARRLFKRLSSGHKIVLLTITRLVETVDERTLVLLDEPEAHLHPPLLAAFVRALSDLLIQRNGVAIIATHSPVVLQEAPRSCVWILRRSGSIVCADRPSIETFGENVGILTREVFGLEVTQSGFHKLLEEVIAKEADYDAVVRRFGDQLGAEARVIVRGLLASRPVDQPEDA